MILFLLQNSLLQNDYAVCFEPTEILRGDKATQRLYVVLQPLKDLTALCKAVHGQKANISLFVEGIEDKVIPLSKEIVLNMSESTVTFSVQLVDTNYTNNTNVSATDLYELISNKIHSSYKIQSLASSLEGSIQQMLFNTLDATNCWSSCIMNYDINSSQSFVELTVVPNDCSISNEVSVSVEYAVADSNQWSSFVIQPYTSSSTNRPIDSNKSQVYRNNSSFNHSSTLKFVQYYNDYNGSTDADTKKLKEDYMAFLNTFLHNRNLQVKLVVQETATQIKQSYYTYVNNLTGTNMDCYGYYYLYQSRTDLALYVTNRSHCSQIREGNTMNVTAFLKNSDGSTYQQTKQVQNTLFEDATLLRFDLENEWPVNNSVINYVVYMTVYYNYPNDTVQLSTELTYPGKLTKTCFQQVSLILSKYEICMDMYLVQIVNGTQLYDNNVSAGDDLNCIARFNAIDHLQKVTAYWDTESFVISTRNYTMYTTFAIKKFENFYQRLCIKETFPPVVPIISGSLYQRSLIQVAKVDQYGLKQASGIYINNNGAYYVDDIVFDTNKLMYIWCFIPALLSILILGLFMYIQFKQNK